MEKENKSKVFFDLGLAAKSQLSRKLLLLFLTIAIVEAAFVGLLAFGVVTAGKTAEREFKILALSQEAAGILKLARNAWLAGERAVYHPEKFGRYKELYEKVQTALEQLSDNMHKEGFRSMSLDDIRDSLQEISNFISQRITQGRSSGPATRQEAKELIDKSCLCYQSFLETVQQFQKLAKASASKSPLVIDGAILLWGSALTNLGFLILVALFMEREITRPVAGLIKNCQLLEKRELMPEPVHSSTEINALEKSFFEMSKTLNQNEKRRQSYIGLLRDVQEASLGGLSERIKVLSSDPQLPPKVQKMYSSFSNNVRNMLRLVAGMSESLSTEQTNINPQYEVISCASLLEQAKASVDSLCRERDITLDLKCKDEDVQLDQQLIGRVLLNFLSNAIKYSPEHAKVLLIAEPADEAALSARLPEHAVKAGTMIFYVEDHGPGMTAANVEKLFNKFVQVEAVDGVKRAGTGLGLAICKDIVEAHGGSVGCLSEPGKGSIFWFTVPKKKLASLSTGSNKPSSLPLGHVSGSLLNFPQSIKRSFVTTLLIFLLGQFGIALVLGYNFHQASEKAAIFANNKRVAFQTQELLGQWLVWNRKMMFAIMTMNFRLVRKITPLLEENVARADWLIDHTKGSPQVNEKLRTVKRNFLRFVRVSEKTVAVRRHEPLPYIGWLCAK
ncbi:MAG: HAMP domain-containing histidine kinase [Candidatus Obscuribacterales bacterium]|jgi:signal transduction histidine kinase|nr:HAMP domain-containing histidine kinase [Candidatus Obscuribacterales bacterium]